MAGGEIILYTTEDGVSTLSLRVENGTVWLTQAEIAELFQTTPQAITQLIRTIYGEGELDEEETCKELLQVRTEGERQVRRSLKTYRLEMILAIGYRVRSHRGTQFRRWATEKLRDYLVKGFVLDELRLRDAGDPFEQLLERIRDIRSSEKVFYKAVLKIYSTSIDYDPRASQSQSFFATVQNKMHWAAHGHTAAELVVQRANASVPNMGLTSYPGERVKLDDAKVAKNYLNAEELEALNRIVTAYLEFAELQAMNRRPMTMADWIVKLDDFLKLSERDILTHAGRISQDQAADHVRREFEKFRTTQTELPSPVEQHFRDAIAKTKQIVKEKAAGLIKGRKA
jgi:hypothetical protein